MVDDKERDRLVHAIRALANALVLSMFLTVRFFVNVIEWTLDAYIIAFVLFVTTITAVNLWISYAFEKNSRNQTMANSHEPRMY